jgi:hypothetical protein
MGSTQLRQTKRRIIWTFLFVLGFCCVFTGMALAQVDQGAINGVVKDSSGAVIPGALVTLTNTDMNFVLQGKTDARGEYTFSPIKIGHYTVSASAPKFETTTQENVTVNIQDRLNIPLTLKLGSVLETVTVTTAPPMLQSESASVGQVMDTDTINNTPLNGRNWIYIAQLTAGVAPALQGNNIARGGGSGDFSANGQRTTQNNFILDGVDNNVNVDDEQNGASYNVRPPPDALAEFKIDTSDYSAEFGHSAGAVLNASIKSGTNHIHGDLWEYVRNTKFDAQDWTSGSIPAYHQNQFGATLGLPFWKNKVFYFVDAEANRIDQATAANYTVPTDTERTGDFTEMFLTSKATTARSGPTGLFAPNTAGCLPLTQSGGVVPNPGGDDLNALSGTISAGPLGTVTCPGGLTTNVMTPGNPPLASGSLPTGNGAGDGQLDTVAQEVFAAYPHANFNNQTGGSCSSATPGGCPLYTNYRLNLPKKDDTWQWDQRVDWNATAKDQTYARFSYTHEQFGFTPPLGPVIDGGNTVPDGFHGSSDFNLGKNFMLSETHIFNPKLINEFRFGYNWGFFGFLQSNANTPASVLIPGLGGVPFAGTAEPNGGLPEMTFGGLSGLSAAGARHDVPSIERQNIYQILDNVTKQWRNHSFKFGMQLETIRTSFSQAQYPRNLYQFFGGESYTGKAGATFAGSGMADAFTDNIGKTRISPGWNTSYYRWYKAFYAQDDWKFNSKLTVNLGVRYDYIEPESNNAGDVANFQPISEGIDANGNGTGSGVLQASTLVESQNVFPASYITSLAGSNIHIEYLNSKSMMNAQKTNFAPRVGFAYQIDPKTVVRAGFGMFFGAIELPGGAELTVNFPWSYTAIITNQFLGSYSCYASPQSGASNTASYCPSTGVPNSSSTVPGFTVTAPTKYPTSLEIGGSEYLSNLSAYAGTPTINRMNYNMKTPYTMSYNLTFERQIGKDMIATLGYVGNVARHTWTITNFGGALMLTNSDSSNQTAPFPSASGGFYPSDYIGEQMYNSLQSKLEKRLSNGLSFLATYTWSRAMDDGSNAGIGGGPGSFRNTQLIPIKDEMTNAVFDVRHRVTVNGFYDLPFGKGRKWANQGGLLDYAVGGWQTSLTWVAQTGNPFTVYPGGGTFNGAGGGTINAIRIGDPFKGGGIPDARNLDSSSCPTTVKNRANWYNPCAFIDPLSGISTAQMIQAGEKPTKQNGNGIPWIDPTKPGTNSVPVTGINAAISYLGGKQNQIYGPGYERVNMSIFKNFKTWRAQYFQFRADAFNLLNHPTWGQPGDTSLDSNAGQITSTQSFQSNTPDARFFQLAGKYVF